MQRTKSTLNGSVRARGFQLRELLYWNDHMSRTKMTVALAKAAAIAIAKAFAKAIAAVNMPSHLRLSQTS